MHRVSSSKDNHEPHRESLQVGTLKTPSYITSPVFKGQKRDELGFPGAVSTFGSRCHRGHGTRPGNAHNNSRESFVNYVRLGVHDAEEGSSHHQGHQTASGNVSNSHGRTVSHVFLGCETSYNSTLNFSREGKLKKKQKTLIRSNARLLYIKSNYFQRAKSGSLKSLHVHGDTLPLSNS